MNRLSVFWRSLAPPPRLSLAEWAETYMHLAPEFSSAPGLIRLYPYQREIMETLTDPAIEQVTVMKSARVGYTTILDAFVGYSIHYDPASLLIVQPTIDDCTDYVKDELDPMIRVTPVLRDLVAKAKRGPGTESTMKVKRFPGGQAYLVGSNAARGFRRRTVKRVLFDEIDGYDDKGAGKEGDQIALGKRRTETYADRKLLLGSTPTIKGASRIEAAYGESDGREYHVPCPHCEHFQPLVWERFSWPEGKPEEIVYSCESCAATIEESWKRWMVERGVWVAQRPEVKGHVGFFIWAAYSYAVNATWPNIAAESEEAKRLPGKWKVFANTILGRTHEDDSGDRPDEGSLMARERFADAPEERLARTMGVDVQGDRLEYELVGWGEGFESWSLRYGVVWGSPAKAETWKQLQGVIDDERPYAVCIDSGGHHTEQVYRFQNVKRRIFAIKGATGRRPVWPLQASQAKGGYKVWVLGVDAAKDEVFSHLKVERPGPGFCHFPEERDERWFLGLTSEMVVVRHHKGFPVREYKRRTGVPNEPLDCRVYAYAALCSFTRVDYKGLTKQRAKAREEAVIAQAEPVKPQSPAPKRTWVTRSKWASW